MKVKYFNIAILNVFLLVTLSVSVYGSVYNTYYCQASPISAETPKVVLQSGTAGTSTIYTNNTSAKVSVVAPRNWWNLDYDYNRQISIVNNVASTLGSGYSICVTIDTASMVSAGKMMTNGNDLRIVWWNSTSESYVELDRANETNFNSASTKIWFKLQRGIAASSSDNNYYLYYGYPSAVNPPNDWAKVYNVGDNFNDGTITSGLNTTTSGVASITETGGECFMDLGTSDADAGMVVTENPLPTDKKFMIRYKVNLVSLGSGQELKAFSINQWDGRPTVCVNTIYNPTRRIHVLQYATYLKLVYEGTGGRMHWNGTNWTSTASTLSCSVGTYYIWEFISNGTNWYIVWKYANETVIGQTDLVAWSSVTDNGYDWWFLWSEPYTNYWWGDVKVDFFYLRDYVSPEPAINVGTEETVTYDYVLKIVNRVTDSWQVNLKVNDSSNIGRLTNATISFHDGTTSDQIIVSNGSIIQSEGALYDLAGNATIYISISNLQATTTDTSHLCVYLKILVPNTSTYNLFIIVFEIT